MYEYKENTQTSRLIHNTLYIIPNSSPVYPILKQKKSTI